jgi:hypothetical protein
VGCGRSEGGGWNEFVNVLTTILKAFLGVSSVLLYIEERNEAKPRRLVPRVTRCRLNTGYRHEWVNSRSIEYNRTHLRERNTEKGNHLRKISETLDGLWILESTHIMMMNIFISVISGKD